MARAKQTKPKQARAKKPAGKGATAKARKPKPTAAELSDDQQRALLFSHKRKLVPLLKAEADAKAAVTKAFEAAKKEGVAKRDIKLAIALTTEEGEEKAKSEFAGIARVARWMGVPVGTQADLFPKLPQAEQDYEDGKRAALDDQPAKPPSHLSDKRCQNWLEGHGAGRTTLNVQRASGFKPLGEAAASVAEKVAPSPIGTEEPTHRVAA